MPDRMRPLHENRKKLERKELDAMRKQHSMAETFKMFFETGRISAKGMAQLAWGHCEQKRIDREIARKQ